MKQFLSILACGMLFGTAANADLIRVEMGAGMWNQGPSGDILADDGAGFNGEDVLDEDTESKMYVWALVKHPVPVVPNLRLEYAQVSGEGEVTGTFEDFVATGETSNIDMTQIDLIPYYNILDNTFWTTLDLGIAVKMLSTDYKAEDVNLDTGGGTNIGDYTDSASVVIPMAYARVRAQIPMTGVGLEADVKYITYGDSTVYDARAKVDYTLDFIPVVQPGLEVGYRVQKFELNDLDNIEMNMNFAGVYAGLMVRF